MNDGPAGFAAIEQRRVTHGISINRLCRRADIDSSTYHRRLANPERGTFEVNRKLEAALASLIEERAAAAESAAERQQQ